MSGLPAALLALAVPAGGAEAACVHPEARSPKTWARQVVQHAVVIADAEVVRAQDAGRGEPALVRLLRRYRGPEVEQVAIALPPRSDIYITEQYVGFDAAKGERRFLILYGGPDGYETSPCSDLLANDARIRAAIIRASRVR